MTLADALDIVALPCSVVLTAGISWVASLLATYLREKTHNERLARLVDGAGRIADDITDRLKEMPPGTDLKAVKAEMIKDGVADAKATFDTTIGKLGGAPDAALEKMVRAGFTKPAVLAAIPVVAPVAIVPAEPVKLVAPSPEPIPGRASVRSGL